jgi:hypothetical protein
MQIKEIPADSFCNILQKNATLLLKTELDIKSQQIKHESI